MIPPATLRGNAAASDARSQPLHLSLNTASRKEGQRAGIIGQRWSLDGLEDFVDQVYSIEIDAI
jgi:hypothetical protein